MDGNSCDEEESGSLLRRGIKFSSVGEFLNFLYEGEVKEERSLSYHSSGSFEVLGNEAEGDKKQSDLRCSSKEVEVKEVIGGGAEEGNAQLNYSFNLYICSGLEH